MNLKTDGPDCKMIFKFGKHIERLHSARKQYRRIYICSFCGAKQRCKTLVGKSQPLSDLYRAGAGQASFYAVFMVLINPTPDPQSR